MTLPIVCQQYTCLTNTQIQCRCPHFKNPNIAVKFSPLWIDRSSVKNSSFFPTIGVNMAHSSYLIGTRLRCKVCIISTKSHTSYRSCCLYDLPRARWISNFSARPDRSEWAESATWPDAWFAARSTPWAGRELRKCRCPSSPWRQTAAFAPENGRRRSVRRFENSKVIGVQDFEFVKYSIYGRKFFNLSKLILRLEHKILDL